MSKERRKILREYTDEVCQRALNGDTEAVRILGALALMEEWTRETISNS